MLTSVWTHGYLVGWKSAEQQTILEMINYTDHHIIYTHNVLKSQKQIKRCIKQ